MQSLGWTEAKLLEIERRLAVWETLATQLAGQPVRFDVIVPTFESTQRWKMTPRLVEDRQGRRRNALLINLGSPGLPSADVFLVEADWILPHELGELMAFGPWSDWVAEASTAEPMFRMVIEGFLNHPLWRGPALSATLLEGTPWVLLTGGSGSGVRPGMGPRGNDVVADRIAFAIAQQNDEHRARFLRTYLDGGATRVEHLRQWVAFYCEMQYLEDEKPIDGVPFPLPQDDPTSLILMDDAVWRQHIAALSGWLANLAYVEGTRRGLEGLGIREASSQAEEAGQVAQEVLAQLQRVREKVALVDETLVFNIPDAETYRFIVEAYRTLFQGLSVRQPVRSGVEEPPVAGLEEPGQGFWPAVAAQAAHGITPIVLGPSVAGHQALAKLAGLEQASMVEDRGADTAVELIGTYDAHEAIYVGLEDEARRFAAVAARAGLETHAIVVTRYPNLILAITAALAQATGLEEADIENHLKQFNLANAAAIGV